MAKPAVWISRPARDRGTSTKTTNDLGVGSRPVAFVHTEVAGCSTAIGEFVRGPFVDHTVGTAEHFRRDVGRYAGAKHTPDLRTNAPQRPGGQGVVGSNPAVPTQVRGLIENRALTPWTSRSALLDPGVP